MLPRPIRSHLQAAARGFSLIELLVVIGLITLLVALVLVSLRGLRESAGRTKSLDAVRQLALAYSSYSGDHNYVLMPGYLTSDVLFNDIDPPIPETMMPRLEDGTVLDACSGDFCDFSSYVWRLAPYLDHAWDIFFADLPDASVLAQLHAESESGVYGPGSAGPTDIGISERPAFGMNSIFIGGDTAHGGAECVALHPWNPSLPTGSTPLAATRMSQVKNPSRLIVFGPAAKAMASGDPAVDVYDDPSLGFCELRPPYIFLDTEANTWIEPEWRIGTGGRVERTATGDYGLPGAGLPINRGGTNPIIPVAHLDGSASVEDLAELSRDMRRWAPGEVSQRATTPPS